jgi:membrane fusion protein, copper/silver efflux system
MKRASSHLPALALAGLAVVGCHHASASRDPSEDAHPPRLVRESDGSEMLELRADDVRGLTFTSVRHVDLPRTLETTGLVTLDDRRAATIISRVSGRVEDVYVSQWDEVRRGEPIVELYSPDYMTTAAEYLQAAATSKIGAGPGLPDAANLTAAIVDAARRKLELLGLDPHDIDGIDAPRPTFRMRAPISGTVVEKQVVKGSQVNPGDVLFRLAVADRVWITADVYETDLSRVREGETLEAVPVAFPDRTFKGVIARVSPNIDAATHTAAIRCEIANDTKTLRPQMLVRVRIETSPGGTLLVPQAALVFETDGYYAYVEHEPGKVSRRKVAIASWNEGGFARVVDGLSDGERVVEAESIQVNVLWHRAHGESS